MLHALLRRRGGRWIGLLAIAALPVAAPAHRPAKSTVPAVARPGARSDISRLTPYEKAFLDTLERRTFLYFWDLGDTTRGLTPDRAPTHSFVSVGAVGFGLTAYPIGAERGYVSRERACRRTLATL